MLGKKTSRNTDNKKEIVLMIGNQKKSFELISDKLEKADKLFLEYKTEKVAKKKWDLIKRILDLIEINAKYNYEYLKLNPNFEQNNYNYNLTQLGPTLHEIDYYSLTKMNQENPVEKLFNLLNLCLTDEKKFDEEAKLIINNRYNIPLIEGNERIRINYYIQLFCNYEVFLNEKQKNIFKIKIMK